ncbi:hypothetical protein GLOIN_2v1791318 [Rhizophagus clarus]|nr:hypothetical protein GLOIN_2v1791318 [Rhizophagus clarus]
MRKCPELKYLDIRSIENQIFHFPEAKLRFELLYELKCNTSDDPLYFYELARISHYIRRLIIFNKTYTKANTGIIKLIEVQKDLKFFEWIDEFYRCNPDYSNYNSRESYKEIFLALGKKADNINHLKIYFANNADRTLQKVLSKFHKLKTLIINDFKYFNEELLRMCIYHDLEIFKIDCYNLKAASIIIENSGGHLKKILLGSYNFNYNHISNFNDDSLTFIRRIYENCPLVEYLSLVFPPSREHFNEFEKLLKICKNLKSILLIICEVTEEDSLVNEDELLKILIRSSPISLREIRFLYDFKFSLEILEEFLEKWKGHALSIFTCKPIYEENYIKLINKYMNNRIIKDFRCESSMNVIKQGLSYEYYVLPYLL